MSTLVAARRVDDTIARLSALRERPDSVRVKSDLNQLVTEALDTAGDATDIEVARELAPVPSILANRHQVQSLVANLVQNAREALPSGGRIEVRTERRGDCASFPASDPS